MRAIIRHISLAVLIWLLNGAVVFGEAMPPQPGTIDVYASQNARYTISIEILGYPDSSPSQCVLMDSGKMVWSKRIATTPSKVAIADNGQYIAMTNWGWYDEGASCSLSIYTGKGDLYKELSFGEAKIGYGGLKWVKLLAIAPDGSFCAIGTHGREQALFTVYDCRKGELLWEKGYGFSDAVEVKLSNNGQYILIATNDYHRQNMQFFLVNRQGVILYQKILPKNFSWDVADYLIFMENGSDFGIYDRNLGKFLVEALPGTKGEN